MTGENSLEHWKTLAESYKKNWHQCQEDLEEFQSSSRELEHELEKQLDQQERQIRDLTTTSQRLQTDSDQWKDKYLQLQEETRDQFKRLDSELVQTRKERDHHRQMIRELEQANDDLDRAQRALVVSLEDFEKRMNEAVERNALLESELDEKETLLVTIQRLKDETRELKQDMQVRERIRSSSTNSEKLNGSFPSQEDSSSSKRNIPRSLTIDTPPSVEPSGGVTTPTSGTPLTPSARISALNIVGDLLRKVGALESKLASCKRYSEAAGSIDSPMSPKTKIPQLNAASPMKAGKV